MSKRKIVKFDVVDGRKPNRSDETGRPFLLKLPFAVKLAAGGVQKIKLGVSCNLPTIVVGKTGTQVFGPGQQLNVELDAGQNPLNLGDGEVVARAYPVDCSELELAE